MLFWGGIGNFFGTVFLVIKMTMGVEQLHFSIEGQLIAVVWSTRQAPESTSKAAPDEVLLMWKGVVGAQGSCQQGDSFRHGRCNWKSWRDGHLPSLQYLKI